MMSFMRFIKQFFGAIGFYAFQYLKKFDKVKIYFSCLSANVIFRLLAIILNNILSPFLMVFTNIFFGPAMTSSTYILQNQFSNYQRATYQSVISLLSGIGTAGLLFCLGLVADYFSVCSAIVVAVLVKVVVIILSVYMLKKDKKKI